METPRRIARPALAPGDVPRDAWGPSLPSFRVELETVDDSSSVYLMREEDAGKFRAEHPECVGAHMISRGTSRVKTATVKQELAKFSPPKQTIVNATWKGDRRRRFEDERGELTDAGRLELARGVWKNKIVWAMEFICGGIDTYICSSDAPILASPEPSALPAGAPYTSGTTVLALEHKDTQIGRWIRVDQGWVLTKRHSGPTLLEASGCVRQCGGICVCSSSCTMQVKKVRSPLFSAHANQHARD
jgi:hypothetical protein